MSKNIYILGIVASGKTTLAKRLSRQLDIPWFELDCIVHLETSEGRKKRSPEEQVEVIRTIDSEGPWIFEGTDRESYRCLLDMADLVILVDPPLWKRKIRIATRMLKQKLGIETSHYKPNLKMLKMMYRWTREFESNRVSFEARLQPYEHKLIRLSDSTDLDDVTLIL
ncbi:hypothetical protein [Paenibacillus lemnae]|uniref:DNA topology modulation protein FlaR n=1 Tax=Paenibacillus lemnae TaxID=1330551 RepID=A0A848M8N4_PAELE|nr:hypothetical protein [Paenibacillus lemnae]NMO96571.1 hypothetical protein [Paenibacillus lemnae]